MDMIQKHILALIGDNYTIEWDKLNYKNIPVTIIKASPGNEIEYNNIYKMLLESDYKQITRTESGGVSNTIQERMNRWNKYDVRQLGPVNEITICTLEFSCRIQWRINNYKTKSGDEKLITASQFYQNYWLKECKKYGIDMRDYYVDNGYEIKQDIHKADIKIYNPLAMAQFAFDNIHHLDFHKFYPSGLVETHPEFKPVVEHFTRLAKTNEMYKIGLDSLIGLWQSSAFHYRLANLSRDAINNAYSRFDEVKEELKDRIIATNTDGIWYSGDIHHGKYEGDGLTQWSNDHLNCTIRFKSAGAYEYIENGKYKPVVRGYTKLERTLPREEWEWGDIFINQAQPYQWTFKKGVGIVWQTID